MPKIMNQNYKETKKLKVDQMLRTVTFSNAEDVNQLSVPYEDLSVYWDSINQRFTVTLKLIPDEVQIV